MPQSTGGSWQDLSTLSASHSAGQIKAETVDMHFPDPVFKAADNETSYQRMVGVYRVTTAV